MKQHTLVSTIFVLFEYICRDEWKLQNQELYALLACVFSSV